MGKIVIDPVTRLEGHLKIEAVVDGGEVKEANSSGMLFRGFELILKGRDPRDANRLTQRVCGVCPTAHATASALNIDSAFGLGDKIPDNARIMRNLIFGSNYLQSHILHFYHLAALDYVDVTKVADYDGTDPDMLAVKKFIERGALAPFVPRYEGDYRLPKEVDQAAASHYLSALHIRRKCQEMLALFGGKMPHNCATVPGGVTEVPTVDKIASFLWRLNEIRNFVDNVYIPDVLAVAKVYSDYFEIGGGADRFLSYGAFDLDGTEADLTKRERLHKNGSVGSDLSVEPLDPSKISEFVKHSWFADSSTGKHPSQGETAPEPGKKGGYSWLKSPRYDGKPHEVGPLARMLASYVQGHETVKALVDSVLSAFSAEPAVLFSVLGRHAARALEAKMVGDAMAQWVLELKVGEPVSVEAPVPEEGEGMGLVGAPRGALGHWVKVKDYKIENYQLVVPTTWNASPKDDNDQPGPIEQALIGTKVKDESNPFELVRIVRSFDPCLACAIHAVTPKGRTLAGYRIA